MRLGRLAQIVNNPRAVAIRPHAEGVGALELKQIGDLLEHGGDLRVVHDVC